MKEKLYFSCIKTYV